MKKAMSLLLAAIMLLSYTSAFPVTVLAQEAETPATEITQAAEATEVTETTEATEAAEVTEAAEATEAAEVTTPDREQPAMEPQASGSTIVASGTCGDALTWTVDAAGTLTVSGEGDMDSYYAEGAPWYSYSEKIETVNVEAGVTSIGTNAFYFCWNLTGAKLGDSVTKIGGSAFAYCRSLASITIPKNVVSIAEDAFFWCYSLDGIWVDEENTVYSSDSRGVLFNKDKTVLLKAPLGISGKYTVPGGTQKIGAGAFTDCESLTEVTIPEGVTTIGDSAFSQCGGLTSITVPASVTAIGKRAFLDCNMLDGIWVDEDSTAYSSDSRGVLFDKEKTVLIQAPRALCDTYAVPGGVSAIGEWAFSTCASLSEITLPVSLTAVEAYAFFCCDDLQEVTYGGTPRQKSLISIAGGNDSLTSIVWTCAEDTTCGEDLTWSLDANGTLTISGTGPMYDFVKVSPPWENRSDEIKKVVLCEGVTTISGWAFLRCYKLENVTIPTTVTSIGKYAFYRCDALVSVDIPEGVETIGWAAFAECGVLETVTLPGSLTEIGDNAFSYTDIKTLVIPEGVSVIGPYAFYYCTELTEVSLPVSLKEIGTSAFGGCEAIETVNYAGTVYQALEIDIEGGNYCLGYCGDWNSKLDPYCGENLTWTLDEEGTLTVTGTGAMFDYDLETPAPWYKQTDSIKKLVVTEGVTSVGDRAFSCCAIEEIVLAETVTIIGVDAFLSTRITELTIPDGVESIAASAFDNCRYLTTVTIGSGLEEVYPTAFLDCDALSSFCVSAENPVFASADGALYNKAMTKLVQAPNVRTFAVPEGVVEIGEGAFATRSALTSVTLPNTVETIDQYAFGWSTALRSIVLPDSVTSVGESAFSCCVNLSVAVLSGGMTTIPCEAFSGCWELGNITIPASVVSVGSSAFSGCEALKTVTYQGTQEQYYRIDFEEFNDDLLAATWFFESDLLLTAAPDAKTGKPKLTWEAVTGATAYEILRSTSAAGTYKKVKTTTANSYTDTAATTGKVYYYKVRAVQGKAVLCGSGIGARCVCAQPKVTYKLSATTGQPTFSWGKVTGAYTYAIYRADTYGGFYDVLGFTKKTSFTDPIAEGDTVYYYKVEAISKNGDANSVDMEPIRVACAVAQPSIKTSVAPSGKPVVSWGAVSGAVRYKVYRAASSKGTYTEIGTTAELSFTDETAVVNKTYYYKVSACGAVSESVLSGYKSVRACISATEMFLERDTASGKARVLWYAVEGAKKYEVYRATSYNGKYTRIATTSNIEYLDTKATPGYTYYYKVYAVPASTSAKSIASNIDAMFAICAQPNVKVSYSTTGQHTLSWGKVTGASRYEILRADTADGEYTVLATQKGTSYTDKATTPDTLYYYKVNVIASKAGADSLDMTPKAVARAVARPVIEKLTNVDFGKPWILWEPEEGAVSYNIYRATSSKGTYTLVGNDADGAYIDETAAVGKRYYYKIAAVGTQSESAMSNYKSIYCLADRPEPQIRQDAASGKPQITWEAVEGAKKYEVWRATKETGKYTRRTTTSSLSYTDTGATPGSTYFYKVYAVPGTTAAKSKASDTVSEFALCAQPAVKTAYSSAGQHTISWKNVTGASRYEILRADAADGEYISLAIQKGTSYTDKDTTPDTLYYYKVNVIASKAGANSLDMTPKAVARGVAKPTIKATNCTLGTLEELGKPQITWEAVPGADSYLVYRATSSRGKYTQIGETEELTFVDSSAGTTRTYYYKVRACGTYREGDLSGYVSKKYKKVDPVFMAGFGVVDITPNESVPMASYGDDHSRWSTGYYTKLEARAIALRDCQGNRLIFATGDVSWCPNALGKKVRQNLSQELGIPVDNIILSGTHTHASVSTGLTEYPSVVRFNEQYVAGMTQAALQAVEDLKPAQVQVGSVMTEQMNFVRRYIMDDGSLCGDNAYGTGTRIVRHETEADPELQMMRFVRQGGKDILVTNFQAHPHLEGKTTNLSAQTVGAIRDEVESRLGLHAFHWQGAAGNLNSASRISGETRTKDRTIYAKLMVNYIELVYNDLTTVETGMIQVRKVTYTANVNHGYDHLLSYAQDIVAYFKAGHTASETATYAHQLTAGCDKRINSYYHANRIVANSKLGATKAMDLVAWSFGDVGGVVLPYEMFDTSGMQVKEDSPFEKTFIVGYSWPSYTGYIPTREGYANGGYESDNSTFAPGTAEGMVQRYLNMLEDMH